METEGIALTFTDEAIHRIADFATIVNERTENIGARRLHTVMETLLEDVSFDAPERRERYVMIDRAYVKQKLSKVLESEDLSRFIL